MRTKMIITVLLIAFMLVACMPANKSISSEARSTLEAWIQTSLADSPTATPTLQLTLTPIPTLPKGVIFSKVYDEENGAGPEYYSLISTTDGGYLITRQPNYGPCSMHKLDSAGELE